jgi:hypothetical protein
MNPKLVVFWLAAFLTFNALGCSADVFEVAQNVGNDGGVEGAAFDASGDVLVMEEAGESSTTDAAVDAFDAGPAFRRVFISSGQWTANLGGALGADALCQSAATAASLGGTWMAWLSTLKDTPVTRFVHSTVPWKLLDGTVIANDWSDLTSGTLEHNIDRDEHNSLVMWSEGNGITMTSGIAWTSTYIDGTSMLAHGSPYDCSGFTDGADNMMATPSATVGYIGYSGTYQQIWWTEAGNYQCFDVLSLLCFEQ